MLGVVLYIAAAAAGAIAAAVFASVRAPEAFYNSDRQLFDLIFSDPIAFFIFMVTEAIIATAGLYLLLRWLARTDFEFTFQASGKQREFWLGMAIGVGLICLGTLVMFLAGAYEGLDPKLNVGILWGLGVGIGAAFLEEAVFRGLLYRIVEARLGTGMAMVAIGVTFGAMHLGNEGAGVMGTIAIIVSAGMLLTLSYTLTGRYWLPIGIHLGWNASQSAIFGFSVSGNEAQRGLFIGETSGPSWLSGGSMGIEGSLPMVLIAAAAGAVMWVMVVRRGKWRTLRAARNEVQQAKSEIESKVGGQAPTLESGQG